MRPLFRLHLGTCIVTISVPQASSPITVKFDACLTVPCGDLNNECYIQDSEISRCRWSAPSSSHEYNCRSQYGDPPCLSWGCMGGGQWTRKGVLHKRPYGILAIWVSLSWQLTIPKMQICRVSSMWPPYADCEWPSVHWAIQLPKTWPRRSHCI
jgi:hypothetical protein